MTEVKRPVASMVELGIFLQRMPSQMPVPPDDYYAHLSHQYRKMAGESPVNQSTGSSGYIVDDAGAEERFAQSLGRFFSILPKKFSADAKILGFKYRGFLTDMRNLPDESPAGKLRPFVELREMLVRGYRRWARNIKPKLTAMERALMEDGLAESQVGPETQRKLHLAKSAERISSALESRSVENNQLVFLKELLDMHVGSYNRSQGLDILGMVEFQLGGKPILPEELIKKLAASGSVSSMGNRRQNHKLREERGSLTQMVVRRAHTLLKRGPGSLVPRAGASGSSRSSSTQHALQIVNPTFATSTVTLVVKDNAMLGGCMYMQNAIYIPSLAIRTPMMFPGYIHQPLPFMVTPILAF